MACNLFKLNDEKIKFQTNINEKEIQTMEKLNELKFFAYNRSRRVEPETTQNKY